MPDIAAIVTAIFIGSGDISWLVAVNWDAYHYNIAF